MTDSGPRAADLQDVEPVKPTSLAAAAVWVPMSLPSTLLGAKGIATRSKYAARGSWPYY